MYRNYLHEIIYVVLTDVMYKSLQCFKNPMSYFLILLCINFAYENICILIYFSFVQYFSSR